MKAKKQTHLAKSTVERKEETRICRKKCDPSDGFMPISTDRGKWYLNQDPLSTTLYDYQ